jgi:hypothetical protein
MIRGQFPGPWPRLLTVIMEVPRRYSGHMLAPTLIGAAHLLFAGRDGIPPGAEAVRSLVTTVIAGVAPEARP